MSGEKKEENIKKKNIEKQDKKIGIKKKRECVSHPWWAQKFWNFKDLPPCNKPEPSCWKIQEYENNIYDPIVKNCLKKKKIRHYFQILKSSFVERFYRNETTHSNKKHFLHHSSQKNIFVVDAILFVYKSFTNLPNLRVFAFFFCDSFFLFKIIFSVRKNALKEVFFV